MKVNIIFSGSVILSSSPKHPSTTFHLFSALNLYMSYRQDIPCGNLLLDNAIENLIRLWMGARGDVFFENVYIHGEEGVIWNE